MVMGISLVSNPEFDTTKQYLPGGSPEKAKTPFLSDCVVFVPRRPHFESAPSHSQSPDVSTTIPDSRAAKAL
jgi:hypothetical protein